MWGVRIQGDYVVTGSMDGTIALIDINTMQIKKHFLAHENEWGSKKHIVGKSFKNVSFEFFNFGIFHQFWSNFCTGNTFLAGSFCFSVFAFSTNFCPIKIDLSGNTVLPQTSVFLKVAKLVIFIQYVSVAHFARSVVK